MASLHPSLLLSALALACQAATAQSTFAPTSGEYSRSTTVNQLRLSGVHAKGLLGEGVKVALLDTGLNTANREFAGNSRVLAGFNAVDGSSDISDTLNHGTHVTGILGAGGNGNGIVGVAPGVQLLMIKVFNGGTASSTVIDRGIDYAVSRGARVINMSLGTPSPTGEAALRRATASNNAVIVVAAGNEGHRNPNWPARYARESWANGTMLAVGAVDASKRLADFSNKAGDTAAFYLVAPGVNILSTYRDATSYMNGTSMAAPAVSGAAALISGYWPYLRANQVAAILLNTTDDLGVPGIDAVYGRGLLNVNRALSPIGSYTYRVANGRRITLSLNTVGVASSQPRVSTPSAFAGLSTEVFDAYGRNFTSDEGAALAVRSTMTLDSVLGRPDRMLDAADQVLGNGVQLTRLQWRTAPGAGPSAASLPDGGTQRWHTPAPADASMMRLQWPGGHALSAGDGGLAGMGLGLMASPLARRLGGTEAALGNPLLGFAPAHRFASLSAPLAPGWLATAAMARGQSPALAATATREAARGDVQVLELGYHQGDAAMNLSAGQLTEQGLLGGYSNAAVGLNQATRTMGVTLSLAWALHPQWTVTGAFSQAHTAAPQASGMLSSGSAVRSQGHGLGLVRHDNWRTGDRLSLMVQAPLRAQRGTLHYSVVTGVDDAGEPVHGTRTVNLAGGRQEWLTELRYASPMGPEASLNAAATLRQHPDHDASAPAQIAVGLRYQLRF